MRFGVSLLHFRPGHVGGIETYIRQLIEQLPGVAGGHVIELIAGSEVASGLPPGAACLELPYSNRALTLRRCAEAFTPWRARGIARRIQARRYDAVLFPQQSIFPIDVRTPAVVVVVDVQHLHHPEHYPLFDRRFRAAIYPRSLARAQQIIAISCRTASDLVDRAAVDASRIDVIPLGYDPAPPVPRPRPLSAPYLYYPAATFPHKGHADLLRAFAALKAARSDALTLVFSGLRTPLWKGLFAEVKRLGLTRYVRHVGFVPGAEVEALYQHAEAVVFPTRFEGFGLPVLEAWRFRKPVFCSDLPIFEELGVPSCCRLDFTKEGALLQVLRHPKPLQLVKAPITWQACVRRTVEVLATAAGATCR